MIEYVCGFAFDRTRMEVALIEKTKPEWQRGLWNGIGGHVEPGEYPSEAMAREFKEETGWDVPPSRWLPIAVLRGAGYQVTFFRAVDVRIIHCRTTTDERVQCWAVDALPDKMVSNLKWLIPFALEAEKYGRLTIIEQPPADKA